MDLLNLSFLLSYFVIVLGIGFWSSRKQSNEDYMLASRNLPWWKIAMSNAAGFMSGGFLLIMTSFAFLYGFSVMWILVGYLLGFLILGKYAGEIKNLSDKNNFYTFVDYFRNKWGRKVAILTAVMIFVLFTAVVINQFIAGGVVLSHISSFNYSTAVVICGAVIMIYMLFGGFRAVIKTDLFQYASIVFLLIVLFFSVGAGNILKAMAEGMFKSGWLDSAIYGILGFVLVFASADVWQRIYAAKSPRDAKLGFICSGLLSVLGGICIIFIGIMARLHFPTIDSNNALVYGLFEVMPTFFSIGAVIVFASVMSSLDTSVFVAATNISNDITKRFVSLTPEKLVWVTKIATICFLTLSGLLSIIFNNVMRVAVVSFALYLTLAPIVIASFFFKLKSKAVFTSLFVGFVIMIGLALSGTTYPPHAAIPLFAAIVILLIGQKIFKDKQL